MVQYRMKLMAEFMSVRMSITSPVGKRNKRRLAGLAKIPDYGDIISPRNFIVEEKLSSSSSLLSLSRF